MKTNHKDLINQGHYSITIPILCMYAGYYWIFGLNPFALAITTLVAWLFWSVMVPNWKLKSIKEIDSTESYVKWYSSAISNLLCWSDSNWFTKTEIWKKEDKLEYQEMRNALLNIASEE